MFKSLIFAIIISNLQGISPQENDNVLNLINKAGYRGVAYHTTTEDDNGWILKIHRIFPKRKMPNTMPVFLMHGIITNSVDYVITGRNKALAYLLADNNFDVFLGNSRGSRHSFIDHKRANYSTLWNFSFNEIGSYDVAAMIDYVLNLTGKSKLFYVGHSQVSIIVFYYLIFLYL
jgi:lysosomal acid lipase/cholesteryl ester hydrolase